MHKIQCPGFPKQCPHQLSKKALWGLELLFEKKTQKQN